MSYSPRERSYLGVAGHCGLSGMGCRSVGTHFVFLLLLRKRKLCLPDQYGPLSPVLTLTHMPQPWPQRYPVYPQKKLCSRKPGSDLESSLSLILSVCKMWNLNISASKGRVSSCPPLMTIVRFQDDS